MDIEMFVYIQYLSQSRFSGLFLGYDSNFLLFNFISICELELNIVEGFYFVTSKLIHIQITLKSKNKTKNYISTPLFRNTWLIMEKDEFCGEKHLNLFLIDLNSND
ncbi:CLUMA_CG006136, isoform A [Clunio marinus]|uniref:CLUMA_CG006136, isoform A n=1 Tax=Clunio marinus TaxID=568069 RepID=A0A1J1HWU2_9DIPT|nr:CLUMA_CG006136, isoform A [Clunio marinus]